MTIGDLGKVVTGKTPSTKNDILWNGSIPFITPKDIQGLKHIVRTERTVTQVGANTVKGSIIPPNAICVSCIGNIGYAGMTTQWSITNQQINSIIVNKENDANFVYYLIRGLWKFFKNYEGQSTTLSILNKSQFSKIEVEIPSLEKQKKIAAILSSIDAKIEVNQKINDNLQQQAKALYAEMFLGSSNDDVISGTLSDIAVITMGQSPSGSSYNEDGVGEVFYQGRAEFGFRFPKRRLFTTEPKRMAETGDVLLSVRAPVGDLNVAYEECCIGRGLGAIHSKTGHSSFVLYTMFALRSQLDVFNGEGTVFGSINRDALNAIPIDIPPVTEINQFEAVAHPIDELIRANYEENCRLEAIRDTLIPKLMSSEIDVSAVQL